MPPGHVFVASFFNGPPEQVTILSSGVWRNDQGWTFGVTYDYSTECPMDRIEREAQIHANKRNGVYLGHDQAFTKIS